jgi:prolyl oligopeptidase PreP (S9A serine peptidase family)
MNRLLIVILIVSTAPLYAQRHQQDVTKLTADARNAVGAIGNDKAKTQTYCQINQAAREKDQNKARLSSQELARLRKQLPEFVMLSKIVEQVDLKSPDGRQIALIIGSLNQSCPE